MFRRSSEEEPDYASQVRRSGCTVAGVRTQAAGAVATSEAAPETARIVTVLLPRAA
jgi:hypothetical protein